MKGKSDLKITTRNRGILAGLVAVAIAGSGAAAFAATSSSPSASVTAVTRVTDRPDSGHGGTWAFDSFKRTLTVRLDSPQPASGVPAGDLAYTAAITDQGEFSTVPGALAPSQAVPGVKVTHGVTGELNGTYAYTVYAPAADSLAGIVPQAEDDNFAAPVNTTGNWPSLAFATTAGVVSSGGAYNWTYATACETWTDSSGNGDGNLAGDGNVTGRICPVPHLYGGYAVKVANTRENVYFRSTLPTWTEFTIVGPGLINGHHGWVHAQGGGALNTSVYSGLLYGHGYTVIYVPVTGQGSFRQVPGTHSGYVFFVS